MFQMLSRVFRKSTPVPAIVDLTTRMPVRMGMQARDRLTGFTGVVSFLSYEIDGTVLVGVQPQKVEGGKPAEPCEFDIERIEPMGEWARVTEPKSNTHVRLGATYRDTVSGFEGKAIRRMEYLGGCVRVTLVAPGKTKHAEPKGFCVPVERIEMVDSGVAQRAEEKKTQTGGPGRHEAAMMARVSRA
jgi:hypothetical protein